MKICWDISTSSQVSNCDGVVLEIYLDHKFQWPQEDLNCESLVYEVVTNPQGHKVDCRFPMKKYWCQQKPWGVSYDLYIFACSLGKVQLPNFITVGYLWHILRRLGLVFYLLGLVLHDISCYSIKGYVFQVLFV